MSLSSVFAVIGDKYDCQQTLRMWVYYSLANSKIISKTLPGYDKKDIALLLVLNQMMDLPSLPEIIGTAAKVFTLSDIEEWADNEVLERLPSVCKGK